MDFLPQLHTFLSSTGAKLAQDDRRQVYEAIAYVISAMPMARAAESLRTFSVDILAQIHAATIKPTVITKEELQDVGSEFYRSQIDFSAHGLTFRRFGEPRSYASRYSGLWRRTTSSLSEQL